jgi:hypothetical protein
MPVYPGAPAGPGSYPGASYPGYPPNQAPGSPYGAPVVARRTNGLAVASLVCSIVGFILFFVPCILGIIFGFVARSQIRQSNGTQGGDGLALAGIIIGFVAVAVIAAIIVVAAVGTNNTNSVIL